MLILLDECLPKKLRKLLPDHEVKTVPEMGWAGVKNGQLLKLAESQFDVFITVDQNLSYQQSLKDRDIIMVALATVNNRVETLAPLVPSIETSLSTAVPGMFFLVRS